MRIIFTGKANVVEEKAAVSSSEAAVAPQVQQKSSFMEKLLAKVSSKLGTKKVAEENLEMTISSPMSPSSKSSRSSPTPFSPTETGKEGSPATPSSYSLSPTRASPLETANQVVSSPAELPNVSNIPTTKANKPQISDISDVTKGLQVAERKALSTAESIDTGKQNETSSPVTVLKSTSMEITGPARSIGSGQALSKGPVTATWTPLKVTEGTVVVTTSVTITLGKPLEVRNISTTVTNGPVTAESSNTKQALTSTPAEAAWSTPTVIDGPVKVTTSITITPSAPAEAGISIPTAAEGAVKASPSGTTTSNCVSVNTGQKPLSTPTAAEENVSKAGERAVPVRAATALSIPVGVLSATTTPAGAHSVIKDTALENAVAEENALIAAKDGVKEGFSGNKGVNGGTKKGS